MLVPLLSLAPRTAHAGEHHFGFTYESSVLNPGTAELQPWTTVHAGRADYYNALEARAAFAYGIVKNLEGAFYWNFSSVAEDIVVPGATQRTRLNDSTFDSFSVDLKYKLSDPVADALGSALYLEGTYGPLEAGVEGRVLLDKQLGSWLFAANLIGDGIEHLELRSVSEARASASLAAGYFATPSVVPGFEIRSENSVSNALDWSVLYFGPSVSVLTEGFWATLALEPQIAAFKGKTPGHSFDLTNNERVQARLLLGFHL